MPQPHTVRLRGPWHTDCGRRVPLPATWAEAIGDAETVRLSRNFNRPPKLDLATVERFALRIESPQQIEQVLVNDAEAGDGADLLPVLADSNRLTVSLRRTDASATILQARLEITELSK